MHALKYILKHEERFERLKTVWVLNKIIDERLLDQLVDVLKSYKLPHIIVHFNPAEYIKCGTYEERLLCAIGINKIRNFAIKSAHTWTDWAMVMDGDCFFDPQGFHSFISGVDMDLRKNPSREYYTCPMIRTTYHETRTDELVQVGRRTEAHPMFHRDSLLRFDEALPFGQSEKQMLLRQLGHNVLGYNNQAKLGKDAICRSYGYCQHLTTGPEKAEVDLHARMQLRNESLVNHLAKLDRLYKHGGRKDDGEQGQER